MGSGRPKTVCTQENVQHVEGNVLFNDALNTFYLRLYGVGSTCGGSYLTPGG